MVSGVERLEADNRRLRLQMREVIAEREEARAAVSDLLAALRAAEAYLNSDPDALDLAGVEDQIEAAIAKAEGRT